MDGAAFHDEDLNDILREFDEAIMDFHRGPSQYEEYLEQMKRRNAPSVCDSGIEESESGSSSPGSSLNGSEENLTTQPVPSAPKAKLGDTQELEDLIADLDKVLEDEESHRGHARTLLALESEQGPSKLCRPNPWHLRKCASSPEATTHGGGGLGQETAEIDEEARNGRQ